MYSKFLDDVKSFYTLELSKFIPKDILIVADEVTRIVTIQIMIQFMFSMSTSNCISFETFLATLLYTIIGICVYWMILKKFVSFK